MYFESITKPHEMALSCQTDTGDKHLHWLGSKQTPRCRWRVLYLRIKK